MLPSIWPSLHVLSSMLPSLPAHVTEPLCTCYWACCLTCTCYLTNPHTTLPSYTCGGLAVLSSNITFQLIFPLFFCTFQAPILFFLRTPVGDVLSSFANDQDVVDEGLPDALHMTTIYIMYAVCHCCVTNHKQWPPSTSCKQSVTVVSQITNNDHHLHHVSRLSLLCHKSQTMTTIYIM